MNAHTVEQARERLVKLEAGFKSGEPWATVDAVREARGELAELERRAATPLPPPSQEPTFREQLGAMLDAGTHPLARAAMERRAVEAQHATRPKQPVYATTLSLETRKRLAHAVAARGHRAVVSDAELTCGLLPAQVDAAIAGRFDVLDARTLGELEVAFGPTGRGHMVALGARPYDESAAEVAVTGWKPQGQAVK